MTGLAGAHDSPLDGEAPTGSIDEVDIDWVELDQTPLDQASIDRSDPVRMDPLDQPGLAANRAADDGLLRPDQPLDPLLERVPLADLHPTRLTRATAAEQQELERAYEVDPRPQSWIGRINPGFWDDALDGGVGRTENCADCARAFQSTLEGRPVVAGAISAGGLPLADVPCGGGGEAVDYSEQWAGHRAEDVTYDELARAVTAQRGSALVFAQGPEGGHAYNVYWDDVHDCIRWADAQQGVVGNWPPVELERRFPRPSAILFSRKGTA